MNSQKQNIQNLYAALIEINPLLSKAVGAILNRCKNCNCGLSDSDNEKKISAVELVEIFKEHASTCSASYERSISSITNNPNVVAHLNNKNDFKTERNIHTKKTASSQVT